MVHSDWIRRARRLVDQASIGSWSRDQIIGGCGISARFTNSSMSMWMAKTFFASTTRFRLLVSPFYAFITSYLWLETLRTHSRRPIGHSTLNSVHKGLLRREIPRFADCASNEGLTNESRSWFARRSSLGPKRRTLRVRC